MAKPLEYNATLTERVDITDALTLFRVTPDKQPEKTPWFVPGQYCVIGLNNEVKPELVTCRDGGDERVRVILRRRGELARDPASAEDDEHPATRGGIGQVEAALGPRVSCGDGNLDPAAYLLQGDSPHDRVLDGRSVLRRDAPDHASKSAVTSLHLHAIG